MFDRFCDPVAATYLRVPHPRNFRPCKCRKRGAPRLWHDRRVTARGVTITGVLVECECVIMPGVTVLFWVLVHSCLLCYPPLVDD
jgi:hypothetical protein